MRALICGVGGQDGAYLSRLLIAKGYEVWGTSRHAGARFATLEALGVRASLTLRTMAPDDGAAIAAVLADCEPDEIYYLSSQSSVGQSFSAPLETLTSNCLGALNVLEALRRARRPSRLFHASSGECFGPIAGLAASDTTPFAPRSPYAVAKAAAHWLVASYRDSYSLYACSGILFNHESPLRPERFVTRKITAAARIARGCHERLTLGRLDVVRDWGWAPDYVEAMWRMLQQPAPRDLVLATGEGHSLEEFVACAFAAAGLDWREHVDSDAALFRPTDLAISIGDPTRAAEVLDWRALYRMADVARAMVAAEPG